MNGGPISWKSRRQDNVLLSTSEAEFVATSQAGQEAIYLRETLTDLGFSPTQEKQNAIVARDQGEWPTGQPRLQRTPPGSGTRRQMTT